MKIDLQIAYNDGTTKDVSAVAPDLVAFEAKFDLSIARLEQPKFTHLLFLAWHVEKRTKSVSLEFEPWVETVELVKVTQAKK